MLTVEAYKKYRTWQEKFPDGKVKLTELPYHPSWNQLFTKLFADQKTPKLEKKLEEDLAKKANILMHPAPGMVFNAFRLTPLKNVKVVILGQDPYFSNEQGIHQAMGLSFSVAKGLIPPPSLKNVYENLLKYKHISKKPKHGNLEFWAYQGVLMFNTSLTVLDGTDNRNCHQNYWAWFTDEIIRYISKNCDKVVFVLWGAPAVKKMNLIDLDKHETIASSHPSPLSVNKTLQSYDAFENVDHFGEINKYLQKWGKAKIIWRL